MADSTAADALADSFVFDLEESQGSYDLEASPESARSRGGGGGGGSGRGGPGQHASRRAPAADGKPGSDFWDRVQRGKNTTKVGSNTNPRELASQIAAQARAAVDCPVLQCVGPQSTNQAMKAIAIARTYLEQSDAGAAARSAWPCSRPPPTRPPAATDARPVRAGPPAFMKRVVSPAQ